MAAPCCKVNTVLNYRSLELSCGVSARLSTTRFAIERADCLFGSILWGPVLVRLVGMGANPGICPGSQGAPDGWPRGGRTRTLARKLSDRMGYAAHVLRTAR
jgi:hypothetical protein